MNTLDLLRRKAIQEKRGAQTPVEGQRRQTKAWDTWKGENGSDGLSESQKLNQGFRRALQAAKTWSDLERILGALDAADKTGELEEEGLEDLVQKVSAQSWRIPETDQLEDMPLPTFAHSARCVEVYSRILAEKVLLE